MRSLRGGNETKLSSVPVQTYAFGYGGTESENAAKMLLNMSDRQNQMNNALSGGRRRGLIKKGGSNGVSGGAIEIPQFTIPGPKVSDQNANSSSLQLNSLLVEATNDASNDNKIGQTGGKGKRRKTMRRHKTRGGKRKHKRETRHKHKKSNSRKHKHRR